MIIWLLVEGSPVRQFCMDPRALPFLDPKIARHDILGNVGTLRQSTDASNASITIPLRNDSGQATALLAIPPLGARAVLYGDSAVLFEGSIAQIDLSATNANLLVQA